MLAVKTAPSWLVSAAFELFERPMLALQKMTGAQRIAWVFLFPNLLIFSAFTFLPIILNVFYATTGSDAILLEDRPYVGAREFPPRCSPARTTSTPTAASATSSGAPSTTPASSSSCRSG